MKNKNQLIEVTSQLVSPEVLLMILDVASDYGVKNVPIKQWHSVTKLVQYLCERIEKTQRVEFIKNVKTIRECMGIEEFVLNFK